MERLLGIDALNKEQADERVAKLKEKYQGYDFEHRDHDGRREFVVKNVNPNTGQPLLDQMRRTAEGLDPVVQQVDVNNPATTAGVTTGKSGAPPA